MFNAMEAIVARNPRFWGTAILAFFVLEILWLTGAISSARSWSTIGWAERLVLIFAMLIQFRMFTVCWTANSVRSISGRKIAVTGNGEMLDAGKFVRVSREQVAEVFRNFGAQIIDSPEKAEFTFTLEGRNVTMKDRAGRSLTQGHINAFRSGMAGSFGRFIRSSDKAER